MEVSVVEHVEGGIVNFVLQVVLGGDVVKLRPVSSPATTDLKSRNEVETDVFLVSSSLGISHVADVISQR